MIASRDLRCQHAPDRAPLAFPDVDVPQGGVLLLSGGAAAGKSSWLALAAGLLAPASGELRVAGETPASLAPAARNAWRLRAVGVLPPSAPVNPALTVRANLALAFLAMGVREDRWAITQALAAVQMDSLANMPGRELTAFHTRRVALARAWLLNPQVLLLDEPVAGLPADEAPLLLAWVKGWAGDKGCTVVIATRAPDAARAVFPQAQALELLAPQHSAL